MTKNLEVLQWKPQFTLNVQMSFGDECFNSSDACTTLECKINYEHRVGVDIEKKTTSNYLIAGAQTPKASLFYQIPMSYRNNYIWFGF